ncbi:MAG: DUF3540 domain-containing protein [Pseudomonadota bacterium]
MSNLAKKIMFSAPTIVQGRVAARRKGAFMVDTEAGSFETVPALSCLIEPAPGDLVLISAQPGDKSHILAILEGDGRPRPRTRMVFPEGLDLTAPRGKISIKAEELELQARQGRAEFEWFAFLGKTLSCRFEKIKSIGYALDAIFHRAVSRVNSSFRYIEGHEDVQAGSMRTLVDGTMTVRTENTVHSAEGQIKFDAEQIHLG